METGAGRAVVRIDDEMFDDGIAALRWQLRNVLLAGVSVVVADVEDLRQLSSTAVATLLSTHRVCRTRGGGVVIRRPNRRVLDLLNRTGLNHVFEIDTVGDSPTELRYAG
jgi:anti-sigma B factor antagonist